MSQAATPAPQAAHLLLVDDHPLVLDAARNALLAASAARSIDCATSLHEAQDCLARNADYDLVILDLSLTDARRLDAVLAMREGHPDIPVLIFSGDESSETIVNAFECSARGYVAKSQPLAVLVNAVRVVLAGGTYIPPQALHSLGIELPTRASSAPPALPSLTGRQTDVYRQLLQGMPNKVIADRLGMSVNTVKVHMSALYSALQVHNRAQAVLRGRQYGLI